VAPGPLMITEQPALFWGFIASMYVGNVVLLALNLPMVGLLVQMLRIPYPYLYTGIIVFCVLGVYAVNQSVVEVWIMVASGLAGYLLRKLDFEVAPVVLGLVLAPMLEMSLRQSLAMSAGSYWILYDHAIARGMLIAALILLLLGLRPLLTRRADWRTRLQQDDL